MGETNLNLQSASSPPSQSEAPRATEPFSPPVTREWAAQASLALMMANPEQPLLDLIQKRFPHSDNRFLGDVLTDAQRLIEDVLGGLQKANEKRPVLLDRLSFTWRILRQADLLIRKAKQSEIPESADITHAGAVLRNILRVPLEEPLLKELLALLRLGDQGQYLFHYWIFRRSRFPTRLPSPFGNIAETGDYQKVNTIIWWSLRSIREQYIEARPNERARVEFSFLVDAILKDLHLWCGNDIHQLPALTAEIEQEINLWLEYSRIPLDDVSFDSNSGSDVAKAFIKHNDLTTTLHVQKPTHVVNDRMLELEAAKKELEGQVKRYAEENRVLEERLLRWESEHSHVGPVPLPIEPEPAALTFNELREVLKTIDAKYSFDALNAIQLGEDRHLTLRSFASHLFYALRKRGFSEYPKDMRFTLTYESSGLYDCEGFEVPPDGTAVVEVIRKGWALSAQGRWLPIRRARVGLVSLTHKE